MNTENTGAKSAELSVPYYVPLALALLFILIPLTGFSSVEWVFPVLVSGFTLVRLNKSRPSSMSSRIMHLIEEGKQYLESARRNSRFRLSEEGAESYRLAVRKFLEAEEVDRGLEVFSEFFDLYQEVFEPRLQLKLCQELYRRGYYELSARALESMLEKWEKAYPDYGQVWKEKAYLRLGRILAEKLECYDYARVVFSRFLKEFPSSRFREIVEYQIMALEAKRAGSRLKKAS
jgi:tetratricopeptide (TPR) repeat protein